MTARDLVLGAAGSASAPSDPNFKNVSLLLSGDGTNGAQNNTFLDSSTNNFTITRNGNTTQGTFSPYGNLWSNYFDGSSTLTTGSQINTSTTTFTIECWVFPTVLSGTQTVMQSSITSAVSLNTQWDWMFSILSTGAIRYYSFNGNNFLTVDTTSTLTANTWNHIAVVRNGNTATVYLNGVGVSGTVYATQNTNNYILIGNGINSSWKYTGYVSNARLVNGTAVYTSNFTPSTTPLTAVSGTSLLTCQSNRFIDNSSNNFTLTVGGTPSVQRFSPFNPTAAYDKAVTGGSAYYQSGTVPYVAYNNVFNLNGATFSAECWIYPTSFPGYMGLFGNRDIYNQGWDAVITPSGAFGYYSSNGNSTYGTSPTGKVRIGEWNHVALVGSGSNLYHYVNGVLVYTQPTNSLYPMPSASWNFFASNVNGGENFSGYMCDFRLVKGTAISTGSTYPVPTAPLTAITNTALLCNFTNAGIPDAAMMNDLQTVGNAQVSTSVKKYGTGSLYFNGATNTYNSLPYSKIVGDFGAGDFTIECWVYEVSHVNYTAFMSTASSGGGGWFFGYSNNQKLCFYFGGTFYIECDLQKINTWTHVAVSRQSGTLRIFIDGVLQGTASLTSDIMAASTPSVMGKRWTDTAEYFYNGYIDDLRITKGYARYTSNFTPPAQALPTN